MKASRNTLGAVMAAIATLVLAMHTLAAGPSPAPQGFLEGRLTSPPRRGVDITDDTPATDAASSSGEHTLVVLSEAGARAVAELKPDEKGHYRIALPPGDYILDFKGEGRRRAGPPGVARKFTVTANRTVRVDMQAAPDLREMQ